MFLYEQIAEDFELYTKCLKMLNMAELALTCTCYIIMSVAQQQLCTLGQYCFHIEYVFKGFHILSPYSVLLQLQYYLFGKTAVRVSLAVM